MARLAEGAARARALVADLERAAREVLARLGSREGDGIVLPARGSARCRTSSARKCCAPPPSALGEPARAARPAIARCAGRSTPSARARRGSGVADASGAGAGSAWGSARRRRPRRARLARPGALLPAGDRRTARGALLRAGAGLVARARRRPGGLRRRPPARLRHRPRAPARRSVPSLGRAGERRLKTFLIDAACPAGAARACRCSRRAARSSGSSASAAARRARHRRDPAYPRGDTPFPAGGPWTPE